MNASGKSTGFSVVPRRESTADKKKLHVLAIDEDHMFRGLLAKELEEHDFAVTPLTNGQGLLENPTLAENADIIVVDWRLPRISGFDLLPRLRSIGITLPVVFLTGRPLLVHEAMAFDRGAVDFVDKSRGISILVHRLRIAARAKGADAARVTVYCYGRLMLKPQVSRATWNDVDVNLTVTEFRIVQHLAQNVGQHVNYREIYDIAHYRGFIGGAGHNGYKANVRSAIKRIRRKFLTCDPTFAEIQNYPAFGYVWRGPERP